MVQTNTHTLALIHTHTYTHKERERERVSDKRNLTGTEVLGKKKESFQSRLKKMEELNIA